MRWILVQTIYPLYKCRYILLHPSLSIFHTRWCTLLLGVHWPRSEEKNVSKKHTWICGLEANDTSRRLAERSRRWSHYWCRFPNGIRSRWRLARNWRTWVPLRHREIGHVTKVWHESTEARTWTRCCNRLQPSRLAWDFQLGLLPNLPRLHTEERDRFNSICWRNRTWTSVTVRFPRS